MELREKIIAELQKMDFDLDQSTIDFLQKSIRNKVKYTSNKVEDEQIVIGKSKIGGQPDLATNFVWPMYNNEYLTFCAQYNLADIMPFDTEKLLPQSGLLSVFIYIDQEWPGFFNKKGSFKVVYTNDAAELVRTDFPEGYFMQGIIEPAEIAYKTWCSLPTTDNFKMKTVFDSNPKAVKAYYNAFEEIMMELTNEISGDCHQLVGEDISIQSSVLNYLIEQSFTSEEYAEQKDNIEELAKANILLLQLDCCDNNTNLWRYGGSACIYFGMTPEDLKNHHFDNVLMAFQST